MRSKIARLLGLVLLALPGVPARAQEGAPPAAAQAQGAFHEQFMARLAEGNPQAAVQEYVGGYFGYLMGGLRGRLAQEFEGGVAAAIPALDSWVGRNPDDANAARVRGLARMVLGDLPGAVLDLDRAIALDPPSESSVFHSVGIAKAILGDLPGAAGALEGAVALAPGDSDVFLSRSIVKGGLGDLQGAVLDVGRAIELTPGGRASHYVLRGAYQWLLGNPQAALADFGQAAGRHPSDVDAFLVLGAAKLAFENPQGALADYDRAVALLAADDGRRPRTLISRALVRLLVNNFAGALGDLDRAIEQLPALAANPTVQIWRGQCLAALGQAQQAREVLELALSLAERQNLPDVAATARELLRQLAARG